MLSLVMPWPGRGSPLEPRVGSDSPKVHGLEWAWNGPAKKITGLHSRKEKYCEGTIAVYHRCQKEANVIEPGTQSSHVPGSGIHQGWVRPK